MRLFAERLVGVVAVALAEVLQAQYQIIALAIGVYQLRGQAGSLVALSKPSTWG